MTAVALLPVLIPLAGLFLLWVLAPLLKVNGSGRLSSEQRAEAMLRNAYARALTAPELDEAHARLIRDEQRRVAYLRLLEQQRPEWDRPRDWLCVLCGQTLYDPPPAPHCTACHIEMTVVP